jgi:hypothetical protein
MLLARSLRTLVVLLGLVDLSFAAPLPSQPHAGHTFDANKHYRIREIGGLTRLPDAYIVVLIDGTNLDSHLFWLYCAYRCALPRLTWR